MKTINKKIIYIIKVGYAFGTMAILIMALAMFIDANPQIKEWALSYGLGVLIGIVGVVSLSVAGSVIVKTKLEMNRLLKRLEGK